MAGSRAGSPPRSWIPSDFRPPPIGPVGRPPLLISAFRRHREKLNSPIINSTAFRIAIKISKSAMKQHGVLLMFLKISRIGIGGRGKKKLDKLGRGLVYSALSRLLGGRWAEKKKKEKWRTDRNPFILQWNPNWNGFRSIRKSKSVKLEMALIFDLFESRFVPGEMLFHLNKQFFRFSFYFRRLLLLSPAFAPFRTWQTCSSSGPTFLLLDFPPENYFNRFKKKKKRWFPQVFAVVYFAIFHLLRSSS